MKTSINLSNIETWIFDLDNTLYHSSLNLFSQIDKRMSAYVADFLGVSRSEAYKIQKGFFREHGTTLRGMMNCYDMEPEPYLNYVHDIDFSIVKPDMKLINALNNLSGRKIVFTNATEKYAKKIITRLGVNPNIEKIFDITAANYIPKPNPIVYDQFIEKFNINPTKAIMFEDMVRNLLPAASLGMRTVWVDTGHEWAKNQIELIKPDYITNGLSEWLSKVTGR